MKTWFMALALVLSGLITGPRAQAQDSFDKMIYTVGTTAQTGAEHWAYILFQPANPTLLDGKVLAVYQQNASVGTFVRKSVIDGPVTDPTVIRGFLTRSTSVGQNLPDLATLIRGQFDTLAPDPSIPLENRIASVIAGAWPNAEKRKLLFIIARQHPAMAMAIGQAVTLKLPSAGSYTFEVRERPNPNSDADGPVMGRLVLDTAQPVVLPAPSRPHDVVDTTAKGDLHAQIRWATPQALRDLSLLQHGYNIYRMTPAAVTAGGYQTTPPTRAQLAAALTAGTARRTNTVPVLTSRDYTQAEVTAPNDTHFFYIDDNQRFNGGTPFTDGEKYWYFVAARDLLGRDGLLSPGVEITMCDRMPTIAPKDLTITNEAALVGGVRKQWLRLKWKTPIPENPTGIRRYYVYRWGNIADITSETQRTQPPGPPNTALIGTVNHTAGVNEYSLDDTGANAPVQPADNGKTFWYTVRAVDSTICENVSGHSAPQAGVLRDREGPPPVVGANVMICCYCPQTAYAGHSLVPSPEPHATDRISAILNCIVTGPGEAFDWAEFRAEGVFIVRVPFIQVGNTRLATWRTSLTPTAEGGVPHVECRTGFASGKVSAWVGRSGAQSSGVPVPSGTQDLVINFAGTRLEQCFPVGQGATPCGTRHDVRDPDTTDVNPPVVVFTPPPTSQEYKIYRRVNDGAPTMIRQGTYPPGTTAPTTVEDDSPPTTYTKVCYYVQTFDEHGNASPMVLINCIEACAPLPTPLLTAVEGKGTAAAPLMKLKWFCTPYGVERFEVFIHRSSSTYPPAANGRSGDKASHPNMTRWNNTSIQYDFGVIETAAVLALNGATPSSEFSLELPCASGEQQRIMIRAVGPGAYGARCVGALSNGEIFTWTPNITITDGEIPWPTRPVPPVESNFISGLTAHWLMPAKPNLGVGIRIGNYTLGMNAFVTGQSSSEAPSIPFTVIERKGPPTQYFYKNTDVAAREGGGPLAGTIFPYTLFRFQLANDKYPTVSGDIVQVTPLMEQVAYETTTFVGENAIILKDPYIIGLAQSQLTPPVGNAPFDCHLYALDRQPVLRGARYQYLFIRFSPRTKEIERVVPAGDITIP